LHLNRRGNVWSAEQLRALSLGIRPGMQATYSFLFHLRSRCCPQLRKEDPEFRPDIVTLSPNFILVSAPLPSRVVKKMGGFPLFDLDNIDVYAFRTLLC